VTSPFAKRGESAEENSPAGWLRRRWVALVVGAGLLVGAVAIALAVRNDTCDVQGRIPEDRDILCALKNQDPQTCPTILTKDQCEQYLEEFNHPAG
jgi:hypothetical protein